MGTEPVAARQLTPNCEKACGRMGVESGAMPRRSRTRPIFPDAMPRSIENGSLRPRNASP